MRLLDLKPTPLVEESELAKSLGIKKLFIKHEEMNPSGSHKDRSIWSMMDEYISEDKTDFVISSSGNAAISAAYYVGHLDKPVSLYIYHSPRMDDRKKTRYEDLEKTIGNCVSISVEECERPKQKAFQHAKETGAVFLRGSQNNLALVGYASLASEIASDVPDAGSVFVPTSSGTTAVGLFQGFNDDPPPNLPPIKGESLIAPQIHVIQTARIHPIASEFDHDFVKSDESKASAIVDNVAHRKDEVVRVVQESGGSGWVVSDKELFEAHDLYVSNTRYKFHKSGLGFDSLLSLAGLMKAVKKGITFDKPIVLLFTGI